MPSSSLLAACHSIPTVGMIFFGCCARATSGHAATPPTRPINSRRRMAVPKHQDAAVYLLKLDAWKTSGGVVEGNMFEGPRLPVRVKLGNTHDKQRSSAIPPESGH